MRVISSVVVAVLAVGGVGVAALLAMDTNSSAVATPNPTWSPAEVGADLFASPLPSETALPTPTFTLTSETPRPEQPPNQPPPKAPAPPARGYQGAPATNPSEAVAHAVTVGRSRGERVAAAVLDRRTGTFYGAGDVDYGFASASVVKTFIAARLLVDGKASDPAISDQMCRCPDADVHGAGADAGRVDTVVRSAAARRTIAHADHTRPDVDAYAHAEPHADNAAAIALDHQPANHAVGEGNLGPAFRRVEVAIAAVAATCRKASIAYGSASPGVSSRQAAPALRSRDHSGQGGIVYIGL